MEKTMSEDFDRLHDDVGDLTMRVIALEAAVRALIAVSDGLLPGSAAMIQNSLLSIADTLEHEENSPRGAAAMRNLADGL
jgi:hypothetical protein